MANQTKKCPMCAEENPLEAVYCLYCGTRFGAGPAEIQPPQVQPPNRAPLPAQPILPVPQPRKNMLPLWLGGIGGLVILVLGWLLLRNLGLGAALAPSSRATETPTPTFTLASTSTPKPTLRPSATRYLTSTPIPTPAWSGEFGEPILAAIANREPSYFEDFTNPDQGWEVSAENPALDFADGWRSYSTTQDSHWDNIPCCKDYYDLVLSVDVDVADLGDGNTVEWLLNIDSVYTMGFWMGLDGRWHINHSSDPPNSDPESGGIFRIKSSKMNLTLIIYDEIYAFYIDSTPISYGEFKSPPGALYIGLRACPYRSSGRATIRYDNVKVWNLAGVPNLPGE